MPRRTKPFSYVLPNEILIMIFNFCDVYTLSQISMVCQQFYDVASVILNKKSDYLLVTNQVSETFLERCKPLLSFHAKFTTHYNWTHNNYKKKMICELSDYYFQTSNKCLLMTENTIWHYYNSRLHAHKRGMNGTVTTKKNVAFCDSNIWDIAYCNDEIISGHDDGSIRGWKIISQGKHKRLQHLKKYVNAYNNNGINNVDATPQHIISSSSNSIQILKNIDPEDLENSKEVEGDKIIYGNGHFVNSVLFDPTGTKFAVSTSLPLITIYDLNKRKPVIHKKHYKSNQLLWEDPHMILMCCRDHIRKMDIRTTQFVRTWGIPLIADNEEFLCFSSDNLYTILTGTNHRVILWDQRQLAPIQMYNVNKTHNCIHSVQFDSAHMYVAISEGFFEYDFQKKNHFDYSNIKTYFGNFF